MVRVLGKDALPDKITDPRVLEDFLARQEADGWVLQCAVGANLVFYSKPAPVPLPGSRTVANLGFEEE